SGGAPRPDRDPNDHVQANRDDEPHQRRRSERDERAVAVEEPPRGSGERGQRCGADGRALVVVLGLLFGLLVLDEGQSRRQDRREASSTPPTRAPHRKETTPAAIDTAAP